MWGVPTDEWGWVDSREGSDYIHVGFHGAFIGVEVAWASDDEPYRLVDGGYLPLVEETDKAIVRGLVADAGVNAEPDFYLVGGLD